MSLDSKSKFPLLFFLLVSISDNFFANSNSTPVQLALTKPKEYYSEIKDATIWTDPKNIKIYINNSIKNAEL